MSNLRTVTFQLKVQNEDGVTKMKQFTRATIDQEAQLKRLNDVMGDNVTVSAKVEKSHDELLRQARNEHTAYERTLRTYNNMTKELTHQASLVGKTAVEQAELNAVMKLGANATEEQRNEVVKLARALAELQEEEADVARESEARMRLNRQQDAQLQREQQNYQNIVRELEHYNRTLNMTNEEKRIENAIFRLGANATEEQIKQIRSLTIAQDQLEAATQRSNAAERQRGFIMQNAGFQIQDALVQAQMGTSASVIIAQQVPQFLSAFGGLGAALGTAVAFGTILTPIVKTMIDGKSAAQEFAEAQDMLNESFKTTDYTIEGLSDNMQALFLKSQELAKARIGESFRAAEAGVKMYTEQIKKALEANLQMTEEEEKQGRGFVNSVEKRAEALGMTTIQFEMVSQAARKAMDTGNYESFLNWLNTSSGVSLEASSQFREMFKTVTDGAEALIVLNKQLEIAGKGTSTLKTAAELSVEATRKLISEIHEEHAALFQTNREKDLANALSKLSKDATISEAAAVERAVNQLHDAIDARELHNAEMERQAELEEIAKEQAEQRQQYLAAEVSRMQQLASARVSARDALLSPIEQGVKGEQDPVQAENSLYNSNMDTLQAQLFNTLEHEYSERARINQLIEAEQARHKAALTSIADQQLQAELGYQSQALGAMGNITQQLASMAEEGSAEAKALFLINQGIAFANAIVNTEMAATAALAQGGAVLGIPLSNIIRATGYASAAIIAGQTIGTIGTYDKGGTIPAGGMGIVSEYGDELVGGTLVMNKSSSGMPVTGREKTASLFDRHSQGSSGGGNIVQNITISGTGDKALQQALKKAAADGAQMGYNKVARDFSNGRGVRNQLRKSGGV